jgi:serine/threonine protein kinase
MEQSTKEFDFADESPHLLDEKTGQDGHPRAYPKTQRMFDSDAGLLTILDLVAGSELPSVELTRLDLYNDELKIYVDLVHALGEGHSCNVIRHVLDEDICGLVAGTSIALKRYKAKTLGSAQNTASHLGQTYHAIWQEIALYCHPFLRQHENISKLLFLCWEKGSSLPVLALELATFGSLEHILCAAGHGPSPRQKQNLTIDIALGLEALHRCNICHGDMKPANILVQRQDNRIVAKIADFGGGGALGQIVSTPTTLTPLWSPPEALLREVVDKEKVDVYSFGLIVSSIWACPSYLDKTQASSFQLDRSIPAFLTDSERSNALLCLKLKADNDPTSILATAIQQLNNSQDLQIILPILESTLSTYWKRRRGMRDILKAGIFPIATLVQRSHQ